LYVPLRANLGDRQRATDQQGRQHNWESFHISPPEIGQCMHSLSCINSGVQKVWIPAREPFCVVEQTNYTNLLIEKHIAAERMGGFSAAILADVRFFC
jgi:hypothetical protein